MPAWTRTESFGRDFDALSAADRDRFRAAVRKFVEDLRTGQFRRGLRVKRVQGMEGCFEMTWAPDGRAIWMYGDERRPGEPHVVWLAIGDHSILP